MRSGQIHHLYLFSPTRRPLGRFFVPPLFPLYFFTQKSISGDKNIRRFDRRICIEYLGYSFSPFFTARQPLIQRLCAFSRAVACQDPRHAQVFVQIEPVNITTPAKNFKTRPFRPPSIPKTGIPRQRYIDCTPADKFNDQCIFSHMNFLRMRFLDFKYQRTHASAPIESRDSLLPFCQSCLILAA